jgi:uncharacterized delta-60 repeat protein
MRATPPTGPNLVRRTLARPLIACTAAILMAAMAISATASGAGAAPGQVDAAFGPAGNGTLLRPADVAVLVQTGGKIVTVGTSGNTIFVERQNAAGALDPTFGTSGIAKVVVASGGSGFAATLQPDGKIVIVGNANATKDFLVIRLTANGALDSTFAGSGMTTTSFSGGTGAAALGVAIAPGGKIVVAGVNTNKLAVVRYTAAGALDTTFGGTGIVQSMFGGSDAQAHGVVVEPGGKIIVSGTTQDSGGALILARYNTNGTLDATFGTGGRASPTATTIHSGDAVALQGTSIVVAGEVDTAHAGVARFTSAGVIDATFGSHGTALVRQGAFTRVNAMVFDGTADIVLLGASANNTDFPGARTFVTMFRLTANGAPDPTFGCNGVVVTELLGSGTNATRYQGAGAIDGAVLGSELFVGVTASANVPVDLPPTELLLARYQLTGPTTGPGYTLVRGDGGTSAFGAAPPCGSVAGLSLAAPVVGVANDAASRGSWAVASDGGVFTFGAAHFFGSMGGRHLDEPMVGMAGTADGKGYWTVAADGGIFAFGDARFFGSMGGRHLDQPVVGMAATPDGGGYWLVASDGGMFSFGDAHFFGSMGGRHLNQPVVGMSPVATGTGYYLVASDGGIFAFGHAPFLGSMGNRHLNAPVVGIATDSNATGYWMAGSDGGLFSFGVPFFGSTGSTPMQPPRQTHALASNGVVPPG